MIRSGCYLSALHGLRAALDRCVDERRTRIGTLMDSLGNASIAQLANVGG